MKLVERVRKLPAVNRFHLFGIAGSAVIAACTAVAMAAYTGARGERFSILNHFISELGHVGVSRLALVFNAGLIGAGALYVPFALGLGAMLGGWWAAAGTAAALVAAVSVACVGVFPMNKLAPHIAAAMMFFRSGLVVMLLLGIAIQRQRPDRRVVDRRANIAGVVAVLAYAVFVAWIWRAPDAAGALDPRMLLADRPRVWATAILEWVLMAASVAWFLVIGLCRRRVRRHPAQRVM
jgi:hypothetical membrane protein